MEINIKKIILQVIAVVLYSFGVAGIVFSGLGASPIDAATYYINELIPIFNNIIPGFTGQGIWLIIFNILIAFLLLSFNKNSKIFINVLISVVIGVLFNLAFSFYQTIFNTTPVMTDSTSLIVRIIVAVVTINLMALGIGILAYYQLLGTPFDELAIFVQTKVNKYFVSKIILDGSFLVIAFILGLIYKNVFEQINVFTIVVLGGLGPLINMYIKLLNKINEKENIENEVE